MEWHLDKFQGVLNVLEEDLSLIRKMEPIIVQGTWMMMSSKIAIKILL